MGLVKKYSPEWMRAELDKIQQQEQAIIDFHAADFVKFGDIYGLGIRNETMRLEREQHLKILKRQHELIIEAAAYGRFEKFMRIYNENKEIDNVGVAP